jgi:hypothetical protein
VKFADPAFEPLYTSVRAMTRLAAQIVTTLAEAGSREGNPVPVETLVEFEDHYNSIRSICREIEAFHIPKRRVIAESNHHRVVEALLSLEAMPLDFIERAELIVSPETRTEHLPAYLETHIKTIDPATLDDQLPTLFEARELCVTNPTRFARVIAEIDARINQVVVERIDQIAEWTLAGDTRSIRRLSNLIDRVGATNPRAAQKYISRVVDAILSDKLVGQPQGRAYKTTGKTAEAKWDGYQVMALQTPMLEAFFEQNKSMSTLLNVEDATLLACLYFEMIGASVVKLGKERPNGLSACIRLTNKQLTPLLALLEKFGFDITKIPNQYK